MSYAEKKIQEFMEATETFKCERGHEHCSAEDGGRCFEELGKIVSAERRRVEDARKIAESLGRLVNGSGPSEREAFLDGLNREHRTLQQMIFGLFLQWTKQLAELPSTWYDLRNEATVETAKKIMAALNGQIGLPLI